MLNMTSKSENNEKLAQSLGISIQSLETRMRRLIPLIINKNKPDNTLAENSKLVGLDMAEAKLLGLLDMFTDELHELMVKLGEA
ncbi:MAG: hypothetical protein ACYDDX_08525 [Acidithiobacillus ferrivorans]